MVGVSSRITDVTARFLFKAKSLAPCTRPPASCIVTAKLLTPGPQPNPISSLA